MNRDFAEMLSALSAAGVEHLIVGAHALAAHGHPRATGDLDIWVRPTPENAVRVLDAPTAFGGPRFGLTVEDLTHDDVVFQRGVAPYRIDLLTGITGVRFEDAYPERLEATVDGIPCAFLGRADLVANKRATGRPKDLADLAALEGEGG